MQINEKRALTLGREALAYLEAERPDLLKWAQKIGPKTFRYLKLKQFLSAYCWVVYCSGFKFDIVEEKFPRLQKAFKDFDPDKLSRMRSVEPVLKVIGHKNKANNFLDGAKDIIREGIVPLKKRLNEDRIKTMKILKSLSSLKNLMDLDDLDGVLTTLDDFEGIGPITKFHLAKNIGLVDVPKPDIWLCRATVLCGGSVDYTTVSRLVGLVAGRLKKTKCTIDVAIWLYGKDGCLGKWKKEGMTLVKPSPILEKTPSGKWRIKRLFDGNSAVLVS
jgi:hypothetical protein